MGKYFSAKDTRQVVSNNFNAVRGLFRLSSPKLTELVQPITEIPYSKFRRLMSGERDITVEELNTLYELLAVPPTTFMLPWSIKLPSKRTGFSQKRKPELQIQFSTVWERQRSRTPLQEKKIGFQPNLSVKP